MLYRDALELARSNPGCSVTRDSVGEFIVRRPDGSLVESSPVQPAADTAEKSTQHSYIERLEHELDLVRQRFDAALFSMEQERRQFQERLQNKDFLTGNLREQLKSAEARITGLLEELSAVKARLARLTPEDLARIREAEDNERKDLAETLRQERHTQHCACQGEVENCIRCSGRGHYVTDGHGNIITE